MDDELKNEILSALARTSTAMLSLAKVNHLISRVSGAGHFGEQTELCPECAEYIEISKSNRALFQKIVECVETGDV
jgi:hypothetical protein